MAQPGKHQEDIPNRKTAFAIFRRQYHDTLRGRDADLIEQRLRSSFRDVRRRDVDHVVEIKPTRGILIQHDDLFSSDDRDATIARLRIQNGSLKIGW